MDTWKYLLSKDRSRKSTRTVDPRSDHESDYGRIIFSPAIRRMHDKTQVLPLINNDNTHTRLTHTLEVAAIGRSLSSRITSKPEDLAKLNLKPSDAVIFNQIVENSCLIHDIGNPPFGHFGETTVQNYFKNQKSIESSPFNKIESDLQKEFIHFDGNAQGLRVVTKLQYLDDLKGLNLTYATLGAYLKYPNPLNPNEARLETSKLGIFHTEKEIFNEIVKNCALFVDNQVIRHPLAYVMEAADTICYRVMDIEDGYNNDYYSFKELDEYLQKNNIIDVILKDVALNKKTDDAKMVSLRTKLIGHLSELAATNFIQNFEAIKLGTYNKELLNDDPDEVCKILSNFCKNKIFSQREVMSLELAGDSVITRLINRYSFLLFHEKRIYSKKGFALISDSLKEVVSKESGIPMDELHDLNAYFKYRLIIDFISGMTDKYAIDHANKLEGYTL